jgi:hypothetical protein
MRTLMLSCALLGLVVAPIAGSEDTQSKTPSLQDLSWIIGQWEGDYILPEGAPELGPAGSKITHAETWRWTMGKRFIGLSIREAIDGKVVGTGQEIVGIDEGTGQLAHWFFGSTGINGSGQWSREGDTWKLRWKCVAPDGKKQEGTSEQIFVDADTYTWQLRDLSENGKQVPDWPKVTLKRKKSAASSEDTLWQAFRDASAGMWDGKGTIASDLTELGLSKGDQFEYHLTWTPDLKGKALLGAGPFRVAAKNFTAEARALSGWDPETGQVRLLAFWSGGLVEELSLSRQEGTAFLGTYVAKVPGDVTRREPIRIDFPDQDHYVITFTRAPHNGEVLSSFTRVPGADAPPGKGK